MFAGRTLDRVLPGGALYRCLRCSLGYRHPRLQKSLLDQLYREGSATAWDSDAGDRTDWKLAKQRIESKFDGEPAILDVGCFDGAFLASLKTSRRFGIEISPDGAALAKKRGVEILGADFSRMDGRVAEFDVITAFDVIEHVVKPVDFMESMAARLRCGGLLIISTGNLDAWSWKVARSRYWYCAIPEHISFLSRHWFEGVALTLRLGVVEMIPFSHDDASLKTKFLEIVANALYLIAPRAARYLRSRRIGTTAPHEMLDSPPRWMSSRDHLFAVFEKPMAAVRPGGRERQP